MKKSNLLLLSLLFSMTLMVTTTACKSKKEVANYNQSEVQTKNKKRGEKQGPPSVEEVFKMDTNNDGKLSQSEVKGPLSDRFSEIDTDKDGFISKKEFQNAPKPKRGRNGPRRN